MKQNKITYIKSVNLPITEAPRWGICEQGDWGKRMGDGRIGQKKWEIGEKKCQGAKKMREIVNYARDKGNWAK